MSKFRQYVSLKLVYIALQGVFNDINSNFLVARLLLIHKHLQVFSFKNINNHLTLED
jgi:hypothetical protein